MADYRELQRRHVAEARQRAPEMIARLAWSRDQILEEQTLRLREVVAHAQERSSYYAERIGHLEASTLELSDLPKIPPLTKSDVMQHWDRIVTYDRLNLQRANDHLHNLTTGATENPYFLDEYYIAATGGSSGKRGVFVWDWETFIVTANITFRMELQQDVMRPQTRPKCTAVICAGSLVHGSRILFPTSLDPEREVLVISAHTPIAEIVERLNQLQPDRMIGYSSIIEELCAEALEGNLRIHPTRVSANSEPLTPHARSLAQEAWGTNIHNQWGSVEIGVAATEGESFTGMTMAEDFLIFEPVDSNDQHVATSVPPERLLVTKLFGTVMPLLRYELTDTVVIDAGSNPDASGYHRIAEVKGRSDNWFVYDGSIRIHPMAFRGILGQEPAISEYQVQQTPRGARILAVAHGAISTASLAAALQESLADGGLQSPLVTVEVVDDLPRHPETNKLRRFVPL